MERGEDKRPSGRHWHGGEWTEAVQADWVEQFYTIAYSKPHIDAITWWDFAGPAFIPHGGFLGPDLKPRESYQRLLALRKKWAAMV
jgi:endo-1,4-beta-xylanase